MRYVHTAGAVGVLAIAVLAGLRLLAPAVAADHNDPNSINSIFSDVEVSAADLYDLFGFPSDDTAGGEKVVTALTFASVPRAGILDPDLLYRILIYPTPRAVLPHGTDESAESTLEYVKALKDKYKHARPAEIRVNVDRDNRAHVQLMGFVGGGVNTVIDTNKAVVLETPDGQKVQVFVGGRDDAFFNDLPGFFRSINYAPQFYRVPLSTKDMRELAIPKTLIELEGNRLFNFDPARPRLGEGVKEDLPPGPYTLPGARFAKNAGGNYRFVYSGRDAQAGMNINAIIVEVPLAYVTKTPAEHRIVNVWGESWILKASGRIPTIPDDRRNVFKRFWAWLKGVFSEPPPPSAVELSKYKRVDTDGQPFADAALNEREDERQVGADNIWLGPSFIPRLAHLGWGFGPSITALGLKTSFNHGEWLGRPGTDVSIHKTDDSLPEAFARVKTVLFQGLNMPDNSWNRRKLAIPLRRAVDIFVPNVCAIDMDTTGTWPFGRRLEDQVATRFLSMFLDMSAELAPGRKYHVEMLGDQALWNRAPIEPKTPPNPLKNDKPFLTQFPYLADPW